MDTIIRILGRCPGLTVSRELPPGVGQQVPYAALMWEVQVLGRLEVEYSGDYPPQIRIHPHTMEEGQELIVAERLAELLR